MNKEELYGENFSRERLVNDVSLLLVQTSNNDIEIALTKVENFYKQFEEHVRNIYEIYDETTPLFWLWELKKYGNENYGWSVEEYENEVNVTYEQCKIYFL